MDNRTTLSTNFRQIQTAGFKTLIQRMSACLQYYMSDHGHLTTNTVERFHGFGTLSEQVH